MNTQEVLNDIYRVLDKDDEVDKYIIDKLKQLEKRIS